MGNKSEITNVEQLRCKILCKNLSSYRDADGPNLNNCMNTILSVMIEVPDGKVSVFRFVATATPYAMGSPTGEMEQDSLRWLANPDNVAVPVEIIDGTESFLTVERRAFKNTVSHTFKKNEEYEYNMYFPLKLSLARN